MAEHIMELEIYTRKDNITGRKLTYYLYMLMISNYSETEDTSKRPKLCCFSGSKKSKTKQRLNHNSKTKTVVFSDRNYIHEKV